MHETHSDTLQISDEGQKLQQNGVASSSKGVSVSKSEDGEQYNIHFKNVAYVYRAIKDGYIDINGDKVVINDELKEKLQNAAAEARKQMDDETLEAAAIHTVNVLEQQAEALGDAARDDKKMLDIARCIMSGNKVSAEEEKRLAEYDMQLYSMAKQASMIAGKGSENKSEVGRDGSEKTDVPSKKKGKMSSYDSPLRHLKEHSVDVAASNSDNSISFNDVTVTTQLPEY